MRHALLDSRNKILTLPADNELYTLRGLNSTELNG